MSINTRLNNIFNIIIGHYRASSVMAYHTTASRLKRKKNKNTAPFPFAVCLDYVVKNVVIPNPSNSRLPTPSTTSRITCIFISL